MLTWDQAQQMLDVHRFARDHHQTPGAAGAYDRLLKAMVDHAWSGRRAVKHPTIAEVQEQRQAMFMQGAARLATLLWMRPSEREAMPA